MFDLTELTKGVLAHGRVSRVVIVAHDGSSPRETGTAMLIWAGGQSGTIGGGALEWDLAAKARALLAQGGQVLERVALGPALGQCCGGAVTVLTEVFDAQSMPQPEAGVFARPVNGSPMPLSVKRVLDRARGQGVLPAPHLVQGWFVEPMAPQSGPLWIWGAGHVGRALVAVLAPLPAVQITWVDVAVERFPDSISDGVIALPCANPARLVPHALRDAKHLILTYSHALDLELCHRLLNHGFARAGVIGSATKWARFRSRLSALGHTADQIARIDCPIGDPSLGKHPQAIAIGVATAFLRQTAQSRTVRPLRQESAP
ncbi:MAG: xanthine dehydrogenase accessory protein XdhC [Paracoccaceae bacterium]